MWMIRRMLAVAGMLCPLASFLVSPAAAQITLPPEASEAPKEAVKPPEPLKVAEINRVPYLSTYYVQPRVNVSEKAVISYYVTDYEQKEYMLDDHSVKFTVDYWINGEKKTLRDVGAGDNTITLPPLPAGKVLFALQATDAQGRKSRRHYQEFLVVDPAEAQIPQDKVLIPELAKFGIRNDDTQPVETTQGLTKMLKWASENGYRKVVLPKGTYRIDEKQTVQMATKLTLDMNGATFKLNPNALAKALMFEFVDCYDSHLVNGTFEGDLKEHDFKNAPNNSEWVSALSISQGSEYCSVRDVALVDITGYGSNTNHRHSYDTAKPARDFTLGDIDEQGREVASQDRTTSAGFVDVSKFVSTHGFIQLGIYLGYQGNPAEHWVYRAHFYDAQKKFIETIEGSLYRRLYPPKEARFARFTLYSTATPKNLSVYNFRAPYNCAFQNVQHKNVRCVGMALSGFNNLLVEGCTFENCGFASAKCAFDAEDGWDMMQDLTFRNNTFLKNPVNEFLLAGGHNFVVENNTMKTYVWDRNNSCVFRNNTLKSAGFRFGTVRRSGYPRIYKNTIQGGANLTLATNVSDRSFCVRENVCQGGVGTQSDAKTPQAGSVYYYKCEINGGHLNAKVVDSTIKGVENAGGIFEIHDSRISDSRMKSSGYKVFVKLVGCTITNSHMSTQGGTMLLEKNTLKDSDCSAGGDWSDGHEFILKGNTVDTSLEYLVEVGNSYREMTLQDNTVRSTNPKFTALLMRNPSNKKLTSQSITITGNKFEAAGGYVLSVLRLPDPSCKLTLNYFGNTEKGIKSYSENLSKAENVQINLKGLAAR